MAYGITYKKEFRPQGVVEYVAKILFFIFVITVSYWVGHSKSEIKFVLVDSCDYYSKTILNWENVDYWLEYFNVLHPEIVRAQIMLETGNLTSKNCVENMNLFGMGFPVNRETTATYKRNGYAGYPNFIESIKCYAIWQQHNYNGGDYFNFLQNIGYAEDSTYIHKLKQIANAK